MKILFLKLKLKFILYTHTHKNKQALFKCLQVTRCFSESFSSKNNKFLLLLVFLYKEIHFIVKSTLKFSFRNNKANI